MNIHEYQAKEIFRSYDIPVPQGKMARSAEEALSIAREFDSFPLAVKAQIHAGGRGKGGGVKIVSRQDDVEGAVRAIFGMNLVTPQTGPEGQTVRKILIEKGVNIQHEYYLSLVSDRQSGQVMIVASTAGGMDIEEVAASTPEKIVKVAASPVSGLQSFHLRKVLFGLDLQGEQAKSLGSMLRKLFQLFIDKDCLLVEINPLVLTDNDRFIALDAKLNFDGNALYRQPAIVELADPAEEDELEAEAARHHLNYIRLNGNIGNMVNGAGLAMATMDMIKKAGAEPANFLDVGGGANAEMVENGFRIILQDEKVKAIFINIFGGILRCDVLAQGIVEAAKKVEVALPIVVRMEGTNVDEGRKILADSGLKFITAADLQEAATRIAEIAEKA